MQYATSFMVAAAAIFLFGHNLPAAAQTADQIEICEDMDGTDKEIVAACTAVLKSPKFSGAKGEWAYGNRSQAYIGLDEYDLAIRDATSALQLKKTSSAYYARGASYLFQDKYDLAVEDLSEALRMDPKHADAMQYRGKAYSGLKKFDLALKDVDAAIKLRGGKPKMYDHVDRVNIYRDAGRLEEALAETDKVGTFARGMPLSLSPRLDALSARPV